MSKSAIDRVEVRDPWAGLTRPSRGSSAFNRVRISAHYNRELFWALDSEGHRMMVLASKSSPPENCQPPRLREIDFKVTPSTEGCVVTIALSTAEKLDLFKVFCDDLHQAIGHLRSDDEAVARLFVRAARWHHFMRAGSGRSLSDREQRGLYAELTVLRVLAAPSIGMGAAVTAWRGPFREQQDFISDGYRVEVKATALDTPRMFEVNSERQLDRALLEGDVLSLALIAICQADGDGGESLAELVAAIRRDCDAAGSAVRLSFEERLAASGYGDDEPYSNVRWDARAPVVFDVDTGFPAICASALPSSVTRVRYTCDLAGLELTAVQRPFGSPREND
jgi:hypothetical protein